MKPRPVLFAIAFLAVPFAATAAEPPAAPPAKPNLTLYQQGMAAMEAGDPALAESCFTRALQQDPNNANARYQLSEVKRTGPALAAKGREAKFGKVMIPSLVLDGASVKESMEAIAKLVAKQNKEEDATNIIIEDPKNTLDSKTITLKLTNIPAKAAIEYVLSQAGAKARFDEHAIVVLPRA